jgi:Uma2 family endonuclease
VASTGNLIEPELGLETFYYPDLMVCCDPGDREPYSRSRPCLIVEVLSGGTTRTDQHEKRLTYVRLDSLQRLSAAGAGPDRGDPVPA